LFRNQPEIALSYFKQLDQDDLCPNEIETQALLLQKVQGITKAIEYIEAKENHKSEEFDLKNSLSLLKINCYFMALISGNLDGESTESVQNKIVDIIRNNTWTKGSFRYNIYKPFVLLLLATLKGKKLTKNFEKLYELRLQLDVKQLNMLLLIAHKMGLKAEAVDIHRVLERCAARLEISPELITHEITHREIMRNSLTKNEQYQRYMLLADLHKEAGRLYRAMRKYYLAHKFFGSDNSHKLKMLEILSELGLKRYWDFQYMQMMDGLKTKALNDEELELVEKIKKSA
jgi:hypothetical protein